MGTEITPAVAYPPIEAYAGMGPAMRKISPQQRAFVVALLETGGQDHTKAARLAGYGGANPGSARVQAHRLMTADHILAAIREEAEKRISSHALLGAEVLVEIAKDVTHKDRMKAAVELMNRSGMLVAQKVEHEHVHRVEDDADKVRRVAALATKLGLDPKELLGQAGVTVDANFEIVHTQALPAPVENGSADGLEDLL